MWKVLFRSCKILKVLPPFPFMLNVTRAKRWYWTSWLEHNLFNHFNHALLGTKNSVELLELYFMKKFYFKGEQHNVSRHMTGIEFHFHLPYNISRLSYRYLNCMLYKITLRQQIYTYTYLPFYNLLYEDNMFSSFDFFERYVEVPLFIYMWCKKMQLRYDLLYDNDVGFPYVCYEYLCLIKELFWAYSRAIKEQS